MIQFDQPTIFGDELVVAVSSVDDGNMQFWHGDPEEVVFNRTQFLESVGIEPLQTTLVRVSYQDTTNFTRYRITEDEEQGEGMLEPPEKMAADALVTVHSEHALFLPLADCAGAVIYDPENKILMVSHLGRHSVEAGGGTKSIQFLIDEFGSNPPDLLVWLSPAVGPDSYPLRNMDDLGLHEVIIQQLTTAGVTLDHIEASAVNTADSDNYFSHSEYLAGNRSDDGRFAIVAMMRE